MSCRYQTRMALIKSTHELTFQPGLNFESNEFNVGLMLYAIMMRCCDDEMVTGGFRV